MASQKQIDANRANAQRSSGPKTPQGKAASSLNALKHGLTAERAVIPGEDMDAFDESLRSYFDHLQPVGPLETQLVKQIVMASWRLTRLRALHELQRLQAARRTTPCQTNPILHPPDPPVAPSPRPLVRNPPASAPLRCNESSSAVPPELDLSSSIRNLA